ncbi:MAG: thiamine diphosphokinase [Eubacterium sp.]
MGICYIIGAGDLAEMSIRKNADDYVIAADGGYRYLDKLSLEADMVLGDFDSLGYVPKHNNIIRHKVQKDDTDMMLAVNEGMKKGYAQFVLLGGMGGRSDHTVANFQVLSYIANHGGRGYLVNNNIVVTIIKNSIINFDEYFTGTISVFCYGDKASKVNIRGFRYEAYDVTLTNDNPTAVSNEFVGRPGYVSVGEGSVLVIFNMKRFDIARFK